jgi:hypothetical protein
MPVSQSTPTTPPIDLADLSPVVETSSESNPQLTTAASLLPLVTTLSAGKKFLRRDSGSRPTDKRYNTVPNRPLVRPGSARVVGSDTKETSLSGEDVALNAFIAYLEDDDDEETPTPSPSAAVPDAGTSATVQNIVAIAAVPEAVVVAPTSQVSSSPSPSRFESLLAFYSGKAASSDVTPRQYDANGKPSVTPRTPNIQINATKVSHQAVGPAIDEAEGEGKRRSRSEDPNEKPNEEPSEKPTEKPNESPNENPSEEKPDAVKTNAIDLSQLTQKEELCLSQRDRHPIASLFEKLADSPRADASHDMGNSVREEDLVPTTTTATPQIGTDATNAPLIASVVASTQQATPTTVLHSTPTTATTTTTTPTTTTTMTPTAPVISAPVEETAKTDSKRHKLDSPVVMHRVPLHTNQSTSPSLSPSSHVASSRLSARPMLPSLPSLPIQLPPNANNTSDITATSTQPDASPSDARPPPTKSSSRRDLHAGLQTSPRSGAAKKRAQTDSRQAPRRQHSQQALAVSSHVTSTTTLSPSVSSSAIAQSPSSPRDRHGRSHTVIGLDQMASSMENVNFSTPPPTQQQLNSPKGRSQTTTFAVSPLEGEKPENERSGRDVEVSPEGAPKEGRRHRSKPKDNMKSSKKRVEKREAEEEKGSENGEKTEKGEKGEKGKKGEREKSAKGAREKVAVDHPKAERLGQGDGQTRRRSNPETAKHGEHVAERATDVEPSLLGEHQAKTPKTPKSAARTSSDSKEAKEAKEPKEPKETKEASSPERKGMKGRSKTSDGKPHQVRRDPVHARG